MRLTLELPWPPTLNHYYTVRGGRKILSEKGHQYKALIDGAVFVQRIKAKRAGIVWPKLPLHTSVTLLVGAHPPDRRKRDLSNLWKSFEDALVKCHVIEDDSIIDFEAMVRGRSVKGGKLIVCLIQNERGIWFNSATPPASLP